MLDGVVRGAIEPDRKRTRMIHATREKILDEVRTLPAAPQILAQLARLVRDPNSDLGEVTALLKRDAALTARVMRVGNSVIYLGARPHASVEETLARVGYSEVYRIAGAVAAMQLADTALVSYGITAAQLRENSLFTALMMEALATPSGLDARLAYTAGLLRSTGKVAVDRLARRASGVPFDSATDSNLSAWEQRAAGVTNSAAAALILVEWRFHAAIVGAIRDHYSVPEESCVLARVLNIAAGIADACGHALPGERHYLEPSPEKAAWAGLSDEDLRVATEQSVRA